MRGLVWQRPALSHWCTWSPGRGTHSLFVGMLRQQEMRSLKLYHANTNFPGLLRLAPSGFCVYLLVNSQRVYPFQWACPQGYAKYLNEHGLVQGNLDV